MPDPLYIHVNREGLYTLDVPASFETAESFNVRLINHGEPTHVHLHLDDSLSEIAALEAPNHHVGRDSERRVRVTLTEDGETRGNLKAVTAYGATTRYVDVVITEPDQTKEPVIVGEELSKPQPRKEPDSGVLLGGETTTLLAVGGAGLATVVGAAILVQNLLVVGSVISVVAVLLVVSYLLLYA